MKTPTIRRIKISSPSVGDKRVSILDQKNYSPSVPYIRNYERNN